MATPHPFEFQQNINQQPKLIQNLGVLGEYCQRQPDGHVLTTVSDVPHFTTFEKSQ